MSFGELIDKPVRPFDLISKARAKKIGQLGRGESDLGTILLDIYSCIEQAKHWDKLSPTECIVLEQIWTDLLLKLLGIGNSILMHNVRYKLREQTSEETEKKNGIDEIIPDYYQELSLLYKDRIESDPALFDNDQCIHELTCLCCSHSFDAKNKH